MLRRQITYLRGESCSGMVDPANKSNQVGDSTKDASFSEFAS